MTRNILALLALTVLLGGGGYWLLVTRIQYVYRAEVKAAHR